jgi:hypothetical protein
MKEDLRGYFRNEPLQQRYRALVAARETGSAPPPPPSSTALEKAKIERMMQTDPRAYFGNEALQARYRALLAGGDASPADGDAWRATPEAARRNLPAEVVRAWDDAGDFNGSLRRFQDVQLCVIQGIGEVDAAKGFLASFEGLPESVRVAICSEAAAIMPGYIKPASDSELAGFRTQYGGTEMISAWGRRARRCVAIVFQRFDRAFKAIPTADRPAFTRWWQHITPRERMAVLWTLGSVE